MRETIGVLIVLGGLGVWIWTLGALVWFLIRDRSRLKPLWKPALIGLALIIIGGIITPQTPEQRQARAEQQAQETQARVEKRAQEEQARTEQQKAKEEAAAAKKAEEEKAKQEKLDREAEEKAAKEEAQKAAQAIAEQEKYEKEKAEFLSYGHDIWDLSLQSDTIGKQLNKAINSYLSGNLSSVDLYINLKNGVDAFLELILLANSLNIPPEGEALRKALRSAISSRRAVANSLKTALETNKIQDAALFKQLSTTVGGSILKYSTTFIDYCTKYEVDWKTEFQANHNSK